MDKELNCNYRGETACRLKGQHTPDLSHYSHLSQIGINLDSPVTAVVSRG